MTYKTPVSVLVVIHTPTLQILLLERATHAGFWQSVTGSREGEEALIDTARREVAEETGILVDEGMLRPWKLANRFEIFAEWRHRYAPGISHNLEHVFSLEVPDGQTVHIAPDEHRAHCWKPWREAADAVFSWSNRDAILMLGATAHAGKTLDREFPASS